MFHFDSVKALSNLPASFTITTGAEADLGWGVWGYYNKEAGIRVAWLKANINGNEEEVYCVEYDSYAPSKGCIYEKTNKYIDDPALLEVFNYYNNAKGKRYNYHLKKAVLYKYFDEYRNHRLFNGGTMLVTSAIEPAEIGSQLWNRISKETSDENKDLLNLAKASRGNNVSSDSTIEVSSEELARSTCSQGEYVISPMVTVTGRNLNLQTAKITLSDPSAQVVNKNISGNKLTFNVKKKLTDLTSAMTINVSVSVESSVHSSRYYVYEPRAKKADGSSCTDAVGQTPVQRVILAEPEATVLSGSTTITLDPAVCNLTDYSIDAACVDCKDEETDSNRASYIIQDTSSWEGIFKSDNADYMCSWNGLNASEVANHMAKYFVTNSSCGKIYCREEVKVVFPNANGTPTIERGRYFTVHSPFRDAEGMVIQPYSPDYNEDVAILNENKYDHNWGAIKIIKTKECRMVNNSGDNSCLEQNKNNLTFKETPSVTLTYKGKLKNDATEKERREFEKYNENLVNIPLEVEPNDETSSEFGSGTNSTINIKSDPYESKDGRFTSNSLYTTTQTSTYKLPGTMFRYVLKEGGVVTSKDPGDIAHIDLGIATIPVSRNNKIYTDEDATLSLSFTLDDDMHLSESFDRDNSKMPNCNSGSQGSGNSTNIYSYVVEKATVGTTGVTGLSSEREKEKINEIASSACAKLHLCTKTKDNDGITCTKSGVDSCIKDRISNKIGNVDKGTNCYLNSQPLNEGDSNYVCSVYVDPGIPTMGPPIYKEDCPGCIDPDPRFDDDPSEPICIVEIGNNVCLPATGYNELIYRPIDLDNPFPAKTGFNRFTGLNWCGYNKELKGFICDYDADNPVVSEYILNNRGVDGDEVYNLKPMYSVELTPEIINQIQDYNTKHSYDDFRLSCEPPKQEGQDYVIHNGTHCKLEPGTVISSVVVTSCPIESPDQKCKQGGGG